MNRDDVTSFSSFVPINYKFDCNHIAAVDTWTKVQSKPILNRNKQNLSKNVAITGRLNVFRSIVLAMVCSTTMPGFGLSFALRSFLCGV